MNNDARRSSGVHIESPPVEDNGNPPMRSSSIASSSTDKSSVDDLRLSSPDQDGERSSIDDEATIVSGSDDVRSTSTHGDDGCSPKDESHGHGGSDDVRRTSTHGDGECIPKDESHDGDGSHFVNKDVTADDDHDGRFEVDDLEGQRKSRDPPDGGAKSWLVVGGAFSALVCTFGYLNTFGIFQSYYQRNLLASNAPSEIAWIGSTQVFLLFLGGVASGPLTDRYGFRAIFLPSAILLVTAVMLSSICHTYPTLLVTHGVLFGFAAGMIFTPTVSVVGQHFTSRRATATGIAVSGASVGGMVFPVALDRLLNASNLGFGFSVRILGAVMVILLTFTLAVTREFAPRRKRRLFLPQAFSNPIYIWTLLGFCFTLFGFWTPIFYVVEYAQSQGVDAVSAFYLVAIMNATSFVGRIFLSFVADLVGRFNANAAMTACTAVLIFTWTMAETQTAITAWIACYGFFQGAVMALISPCLAQICPRSSDIGTYVGMALACGSIGGLLDTPINGALISRYGYLSASAFSGSLVLVGATCFAIARLRINSRLWAKV